MKLANQIFRQKIVKYTLFHCEIKMIQFQLSNINSNRLIFNKLEQSRFNSKQPPQSPCITIKNLSEM